jgi:hypothetical protein
VQTKITILAYAGIEAKSLNYFAAAAAKNHKRRNLTIGKVKTAVALAPGTKNTVYEVVYLEVIDPQQSTKKNKKVANQIQIKNTDKVTVDSARYHTVDDLYSSQFADFTVYTRQAGELKVKWIDRLSITSRTSVLNLPATNTLSIISRAGYSLNIPFVPGIVESNKLRPNPTNVTTVDSTAIKVDGTNDTTRYISNLTHMRDNIKAIGETEKNFLPLWMRSSQADTVTELGFVNAIPLCYCKPGKAKIIANTINFNSIDFKQYELDVDRYVIDNSEGASEEQYVVFANYEFNT